LRGDERDERLYRDIECPECGGSGGWALGLDPIECRTCKGYGRVELDRDDADDTWWLGILAVLAVVSFLAVVYAVARYAEDIARLVERIVPT